MPAPLVSEKAVRATLQVLADLLATGEYYLYQKDEPKQKSARMAAREILGIDHSAINNHINAGANRFNLKPEDFIRGKAEIPDDDELPDGLEILKVHAPVNTKYIAKARTQGTRIIPVRAEPFGVAFFGDMHADNKGCDLEALKRDLDLCAASGVRAVNIGDTLDNFHHTGKLAAKQAANRMSIKEGLGVARWIIRDSGVKFDAHILGNHDAWANTEGAALMQEWARQAKGGPSRFYDWAVKLIYQWEGGSYTILAAHDFKGHSMHNKMHGLFRRAREDGSADCYVAGHRHDAGEAGFEDGFRDKYYRFLRLGSYKKWDDYGNVQKQFPAQKEGESGMVVVNPQAETMSGLGKVCTSIGEGLEHLQMLRKR